MAWDLPQLNPGISWATAAIASARAAKALEAAPYIHIEHCSRCHEHVSTTKHEEYRFVALAQDVAAEIKRYFPRTVVAINRPEIMGRGRPKFGSFEVHLRLNDEWHLIYSKFTTDKWPTAVFIGRRTRKLIRGLHRPVISPFTPKMHSTSPPPRSVLEEFWQNGHDHQHHHHHHYHAHPGESLQYEQSSDNEQAQHDDGHTTLSHSLGESKHDRGSLPPTYRSVTRGSTSSELECKTPPCASACPSASVSPRCTSVQVSPELQPKALPAPKNHRRSSWAGPEATTGRLSASIKLKTRSKKERSTAWMDPLSLY